MICSSFLILCLVKLNVQQNISFRIREEENSFFPFPEPYSIYLFILLFKCTRWVRARSLVKFYRSYMKRKYEAEAWFQEKSHVGCISTKDALKFSLVYPLENLLVSELFCLIFYIS